MILQKMSGVTNLNLVDRALVNRSDSTVMDYVRLTKPGVMSLVVFSSITGMVLAPGKHNFFIDIIAVISICIASASAAAINMWYDHDIDSIMERTKNRPIVTGKISRDDAISFGILMCFLSIFLMSICVSYLAAFLLFISVIFYVFYTVYLKRSTPQNIVIGGAAGAMPPLIGYSCIYKGIDSVSITLFLIIFFWTPAHFWALALYKSEDYRKANIPMMPVVKGDMYTKINIIIYSILTFLSSLSLTLFYKASAIYILSASVLGAKFIADSIKLVRDKNNKSAPRLFGYSILYLFLLFTSLILDHYLV